MLTVNFITLSRYCIPAGESAKLSAAVKRLGGDHLDLDCAQSPRIMISPDDLIGQGISMTRAVQRSGEFVVVFPGACTAWVGCGLGVMESVRYATSDWIPHGLAALKVFNLNISGIPILYGLLDHGSF